MMNWILLLAACDDTPPPAAAPEPEPVAEPTTAAGVPLSQVMGRMTESRQRLSQTEDGGLLLNILHAHGDLEPWHTPGTIAFDFDYRPEGPPEARRYARSRVDLWRARAVQEELGEGADAKLGWDGSQAWITPGPDAFPSPARFWATTPYYFVGIPWVLSDPGVKVTAQPDITILDPDLETERTLHALQITFEAGTGDSPDDYYYLYTDPGTNRVEAVRYTVTYEGFFPDGGQSPDKVLFYRDYRTVGGLQISHHYDGYAWNDGKPTQRVSTVDIANVTLGDPLTDADFAPPPGAVVSTALDGR